MNAALTDPTTFAAERHALDDGTVLSQRVPKTRPVDPDLERVASAQAGSVAAFEALVRRHLGAVHRQAQRILHNEAEAADVAQETFLRIHQRLHSFRDDGHFGGWARRIATNLALTRLRTRRRKPEESLDDLVPVFNSDGHHLAPVGPFRETGCLDEVLARRQVVRRALAQLPEQYQEIIVLRCVQELSTEESARELGITPNAAKIRLHRAHVALRQLLARQLEVS